MAYSEVTEERVSLSKRELTQLGAELSNVIESSRRMLNIIGDISTHNQTYPSPPPTAPAKKESPPPPQKSPIEDAREIVEVLDSLKWTAKTGQWGDYEYAFTTEKKGGPVTPEAKRILDYLDMEKSVVIGAYKVSKSKDGGALFRSEVKA